MSYSYYDSDSKTKKTWICIASFVACALGLWYVLTGLVDPNSPNAVMEWCYQYGSPDSSGYFGYVFIYGILSCLFFFGSFWGILSVLTLPKLAFGHDSKTYNALLIIASIASSVGFAWVVSNNDVGWGDFGKFLMSILAFIIGMVIMSPIILIAKCSVPIDEEFWIKFGVLILLLVFALFLLFTAMYLLSVIMLLGILFLIGFLFDVGSCIVIVIQF